jgi:predicted kinase
VLVDATFREERQRQSFLNAAVRCGIPAAVVVCVAQPETVRRRLGERAGDASDADWSVYLRVAEDWEEAGADVGRVLHPVSTEGTAEEALGRSLDVLRRIGLLER